MTYNSSGLFSPAGLMEDKYAKYHLLPIGEAMPFSRYLPFLATSAFLVAAVRSGLGREEAHEVIKEHAVASALALREEGAGETDLVDRLADDARLPLDHDAIEGLLAEHHRVSIHEDATFRLWRIPNPGQRVLVVVNRGRLRLRRPDCPCRLR